MSISALEFINFAELSLGCAKKHGVKDSLSRHDCNREIQSIEQKYQKALRQFLEEFWPRISPDDSLATIIWSSELKNIVPVSFALPDWQRVYRDTLNEKSVHPLKFLAGSYTRALNIRLKLALKDLGNNAQSFKNAQELLVNRQKTTTYPCHIHLDRAIQGGVDHGCDVTMQYIALPLRTVSTFDRADYAAYQRVAQPLVLRQSLSDIRVDTYIAGCMEIDSDEPAIFQAVKAGESFDVIWNPSHDSYSTCGSVEAFNTFFHDKGRLQKYGMSALQKDRYGCAAAQVPFAHSTIVKVLVENVFDTMDRWLFEYNGLEACARYSKRL